MTHDYAKHTKIKKQVFTQSLKRLRTWLSLSVAIGIFLAILHLMNKPDPSPISTTHTATQPQTPNGETHHQESSKTHFEFYSVLPERTIVVPSQPHKKQASDKTYTLQIASFQYHQDAKRQHDQLLLLEIDTHITRVTNDQGNTRYRVQAGPFYSRAAATKMRNRLAKEGMVPLVLSHKTIPQE